MAGETDNQGQSAGQTIGGPAAILQLALAIQSLQNTNDPIARARIVASLGQAGAGAIGGQVGQIGGPLLGGAGLGLGLAQIARSDLDKRDKALQSSLLAGKTAVGTAFPPAIPFLVAQGVGDYLGRELQRSSSPQVRGTGRFVTRQFTPVSDIRDPKKAFSDVGQGLLLGGPLGQGIADAIGFNPFVHKPTTGTQFRGGAVPFLRGKGGLGSELVSDKGVRKRGAAFDAGLVPGSGRAFDINPAFFSRLQKESPEAVSVARQIGDAIAGASPVTRKRKNKDAYAIQIQNMLLNSFGASLVNRVRGLIGPRG